MGRVKTESLGDKILIIEDLSNATIGETLEAMKETEDLLHNNIGALVLVDITGARFSPDLSDNLEKHTSEINDHAGDKALVGIFGITNILKQAVPEVEKSYTFFQDRDEAVSFLKSKI